MWQWQVSEYEGGRRLLDALALRVPAAPRAFLLQTIRKGRIRNHGQALTADQPVSSDMCLTVTTSDRFQAFAALCGLPPAALLYEDQHALVAYKPAGLAIHRAAGHDDNLLNRAARFVAWRHAPYRLAPIHRLDIGTSGPVLFGKGREAAGQYGRLLMARRIGKHYLALVVGDIPRNGQLSTPVPDGARLKPARTLFRRLATVNGLSLLELELVTGRPHQVRRQLADAGWPIVGDRRYGGRAWPGLTRPFLHCHHLDFPDLATLQFRQIDCPLPGELDELLAAIGLQSGQSRAVHHQYLNHQYFAGHGQDRV